MSMKFCPTCRTLMVVSRTGGKTVLKCPKCGHEEEPSNVKMVEKSIVERRPGEAPIVLAKSEEALPKIRARCPKCGNEEAYFWVQQTRAADEPPTRFYRCTACSYTWREYE